MEADHYGGQREGGIRLFHKFRSANRRADEVIEGAVATCCAVRQASPSPAYKEHMMLRDRVVALALSSVVVGGFSFGTEAKSYRWNCVYTQQASPKGLTSERFSLEFAFDDITEKAVIIGNQGVSDVEVHRGPLSVTFMEKLNGGVVQTTTVTNDGQSVHSRHTVMGKQMVPSQYYGQCTIR
jgi:hypothetical protein